MEEQVLETWEKPTGGLKQWKELNISESLSTCLSECIKPQRTPRTEADRGIAALKLQMKELLGTK